MKTPFPAVFSAILLCAAPAPAVDIKPAAIIPQPAQIEMQPGTFELTAKTAITFAGGEGEAQKLATALRPATGFKLPVAPVSSRTESRGIAFRLLTNQLSSLGAEGYELTGTPQAVVIAAATEAGLFYGARTLLQLLPSEIFSTNGVANMIWQLPCVRIKDYPRFPWRGLMLDVSRHFFTKAEVKKTLDTMALYKMNTFHWHLVDDHGWRIEIKKYPKLTSVGAWRNDIGFKLDPKASTAYGPDGRYGGFYTQADIREVVAYAEKLHITIVPEIEMPGHSIAALTAYPEFSCSGQVPVADKTGVYCAGKDASFEFLQNILLEVFELFPSPYIHIGGDEVKKGNWKKSDLCQARMKAEGLKNEEELQGYFIRRMEKFINAHGKTLIGWSEILQGGLAQNVAVMDWIGGSLEAASQGHDVVMTPTARCYFSFYQSPDIITEPPNTFSWGDVLSLEKVYSFEPISAKLAPEFQKHILGAQGCVWSEFIPNIKEAEYMTFPRLCALAEVTWSPKAFRNFADFIQRLKIDNQRLRQRGVNFRPYHPETTGQIGGWSSAQIKAKAAPIEWDVTKNVNTAGKCCVNFSYTEGDSGIEISWVALLEDGQEICRDTHPGFAGIDPSRSFYFLNIPPPKLDALYTLRAQVAASTFGRGNVGNPLKQADGADFTDSNGIVFWDLKPISK
jgi:hexosaminidase